MNNPKVSVFTTCYNSGNYLKETLNSILDQSLKDLEVIIVDGGSNDDTLNIISEYQNDTRIKFYIEQGINIHDGFLSALNKSTGDYVICCPISDLIASKSWLESCSTILDQNDDLSLVHGISVHNNDFGDIYFGKGTRELCPSDTSFLSFWCATFFLFAEHTSVVRRDVYEKCMDLALPYDKNEFLSNFADSRINSKNFFFNNFLKFTYNFNVSGYLSAYLPKIGAYVRENSNQAGSRALYRSVVENRFYRDMIKEYRIDLSIGAKIHYFRDSRGNIIGELKGKSLKNFIKDMVTHRLSDKIYFEEKDLLNNLSNLTTYKIKRFIYRIVRIIIYYYYKSYKYIRVK